MQTLDDPHSAGTRFFHLLENLYQGGRWTGNPSLSPLLHVHQEPVLHVENNRQTGGHWISEHRLDAEVVDHGSSGHLHLGHGHLLSETSPWSGVEGEELIRGLVLQSPFIGDPPLRLELAAVFPPNTPKPCHGIQVKEYLRLRFYLVSAREDVVSECSLVLHWNRGEQPKCFAENRFKIHRREDFLGRENYRFTPARVREKSQYRFQFVHDLLLHFRMLRDHPGEPRERRPSRISPSKHQVQRRVSQNLGIEWYAEDVWRKKVRGEVFFCHLARLLNSLSDQVGDEPVDCFPSERELLLFTYPKPSKQLPPALRHAVPEEYDFFSFIHSRREGYIGKIRR